MRQFILQLAHFTGVLIGVLLTLEVPIQLNYDIQNADMADWQKLEGINAEILFVGNSRTWHSINAPRASKETEKNIYALAQDGWQARLLNRKLKNYLTENTAPEILFIQSDPSFLGTRTNWYSKGNFLKYLFLDREDIQDLMRAYEGYHWWEWYIPTIRYAGLPGRYFIDATGKNMGLNRTNGTLPETAGVQEELPQIPMDLWSCSDQSISWIDSLRNQCPSTKVILWHPPVSRALLIKRDIVNILDYSAQNGDPLIDLGKLPLSDSLFKDNTHVNIFGSIWTTDTIISLINRINALQQP